MVPLFRFHAVVGVRVAVRSFAPLFCAIIAIVMVQMYPARVVIALARALFAVPPSSSLLLVFAGLAFLLPVWAAPRLTLGLQGWLRHLCSGEIRNRRGVEVALFFVQTPTFVAIVVLAVVARMNGLSVWRPVWIQLAVLALAGALAGLPAKRRWLTVPAASIAGVLTAVGSWQTALGSAVLLVLSELSAGQLAQARQQADRRMWLPFVFSLGVRAVGWRVVPGYLAGAIPVAATVLFVANNGLDGEFSRGAYRCGFALGITAFLAVVSGILAVRRPVWPWVRSLPWSSRRRIWEDAMLLAIGSLPVLLPCFLLDRQAAGALLLLLPALTFRAAGSMRSVRERRLGIGRFGPEGCLAAAILGLVPWVHWVAPLAAVAALEAARRAEMNQKVTRWLEFHYVAAGDSQSWSGG